MLRCGLINQEKIDRCCTQIHSGKWHILLTGPTNRAVGEYSTESGSALANGSGGEVFAVKGEG